GQTTFSRASRTSLCMADLHFAGCGSLSLVASANLASNDWVGGVIDLVPALFPGIPGKLVSFNGGSHPEGARTRGDFQRAISLCAASDVFRLPDLYDRDPAISRVGIRSGA